MTRAQSLLGPALALVVIPLGLNAQANDPPARAGRVSSVAGTVAFQAAGTPDWSNAPLNYTVTSGDRLLTHQRSRAEIEVGPYAVRLADSTDLSVVHLTDDFTQLGLTRGTIRVSVYRLATRDSMEVDTPNGAIIIRSAGRYRVDVLEGVSTIVSVEDGTAELSGPSLDYTVRRGQSVELTGTNAISANVAQHPRNTDFDQWSLERDRRQESAVSTRYVSRDIPGVADLDHHGHWEHHASYGYVWRPTIINVGWVPYRYGRWVWSGPWGWTWVENSPWGFAPFHYGRWVVIGNTWVWAPGPVVRRPYYAPALVVFIGGGGYYGRHHQAWFPLGYHEPYYPRYRHSDVYLRQVNIANVRNISNVDDFVDVRRADRINYTNRQATTVVATEVFGRRPVVHDVANVRQDEISRASIVRDRWETPRLGTQVAEQPAGDRQSPFRARRETIIPQGTTAPTRVSEPRQSMPSRPGSEPTESRPEVSEPRGRSPLIFRNQPPTIDRRRAESPDTPTPTTERRRAESPDASVPTIGRARPTTIRRSEPAPQPSAEAPYESPRRTGIIERSSSPTERSAPPTRTAAPTRSSPERPAARPSSPPPPQREAAPQGRAPSTVSSGGAQRLPSRRPPT
jgi:hypothetical protein